METGDGDRAAGEANRLGKAGYLGIAQPQKGGANSSSPLVFDRMENATV